MLKHQSVREEREQRIATYVEGRRLVHLVTKINRRELALSGHIVRPKYCSIEQSKQSESHCEEYEIVGTG